MAYRSMTRRSARLSALVLAGMLAAATLAVAAPSGARQVCAKADNPACAADADGRPTTVANACLADAAGPREAGAGACAGAALASGAAPDPGLRPDVPITVANACPPDICKERYQPAPVLVDPCGQPVIGGSRRVYSLGCGQAPVKRACPRIYAPVCGRVGRVERTYVNDCEAERAGARAIRRGECREDAPPPPGFEPPRACPQIYAPVCGRDWRGRLRTYPNDCMAQGNRAMVIRRGECHRTP